MTNFTEALAKSVAAARDIQGVTQAVRQGEPSQTRLRVLRYHGLGTPSQAVLKGLVLHGDRTPYPSELIALAGLVRDGLAMKTMRADDWAQEVYGATEEGAAIVKAYLGVGA